ncbi:U3 small nucleolar RNA-interacting protein [Musa troglodytarum]|uniref:U3 small nucleolar RNA-interacting protein n=1 Tax=Musa troglodytarum TaxID=320322 RepID=A0A9E7LG27_9LILI|nr:U3 small nucleolar RNA-interacting protein [Musa troglodytarum]
MASAEQLVLDLCDPELRENALLDLSKKRDIFQDLAPLLWYSYGTIAVLLQEIVSIYPALSPPTLSPGASNRVCNALALLQVATFIVQKILLDEVGLRYICATAERFFAVGSVLANMVVSLAEQPSTRLLKHIIRCYLRLSDNQRACGALRSCLPEMLKDGTFNNCLRDDPATRRWLQQLLHNVAGGNLVASLQAGGLDHMMGN